MNEVPDWTTAEYVVNLAAQELCESLSKLGILAHVSANYDADGGVAVVFASIGEAQTFMSFAVDSSDGPGSLYDRATASCLTLAQCAEEGLEAGDTKVVAAIKAAWDWEVHPSMRGVVAEWHVRVTIPVNDATAVVATLNTKLRGGAL